MVVFLCCHVGKNMSGIRMVLSQALSEIGVYSAVLLFAANRKGENFCLFKLFERLHFLPI
jgi:hypothetical protein